ncbi:MAG: SPOR domain-containing protein [SAR324 cluster bacterium]|nr:SPOR domain-containing protein [SAR324 cluster bacterium]
MANELDDLGDFGGESGFSDGIDDFMETDLGGGGDGDNELDSFFEDLSTIDDLEVQDETPAAAEPEQEMAEETPIMEDSLEEPEEKKPILVPAIIASVIGIVLGLITVAILWFVNKPPAPFPEPEPVPVAMPKPEPVYQPLPPPVVRYEPPPPPPPPPEVKKNRFYLQVANCVYKECVDDYRFLLKKYGYPAKTETVSDITPMTEVISTKTLREEDASVWVDRINRENQLTGQAYRQQAGNQYKVSMGLFPDLDTANRVKAHLNQIYTGQLFFEAAPAEQRIQHFKVYTGPYESRQESVEVQKLLMMKDPRFQGTFIASRIE